MGKDNFSFEKRRKELEKKAKKEEKKKRKLEGGTEPATEEGQTMEANADAPASGEVSTAARNQSP